MRITPPDPVNWKFVEFPSTLDRARQVEADILADAQAQGFGTEDLFSIRMAVHEALVNAVKHGNQMDAGRRVQVRYHVDTQRLMITVQDQGNGFDPAQLPDPTEDANVEALSGRGVLLMRAFMDSVVFSPRGNAVTMVKNRVD